MRLSQLFDQRADLNDLHGVQTDSRFVKDDDPRIAQQRLRDSDALLVTL